MLLSIVSNQIGAKQNLTSSDRTEINVKSIEKVNVKQENKIRHAIRQ